MLRLLLQLYNFFETRKPLLIALVVLLTAVLALFAMRIRLEEDITRMIPGSEASAVANELLSGTSLYDKIVVKIKTDEESPDLLIEAVNFLHDSLIVIPQVESIKLQVNEDEMMEVYEVVLNNLPLFLDEGDFAHIDSITTKAALQKKLQRNYRELTTAQGLATKKLIADDPTGISLLALKKLQSLQINDRFELHEGYMMSDERKSVFMFITPTNPGSETAENAKLTERLDKGIQQLAALYPEVKVFYYGGTAVAVCNAQQIKRDTQLTLFITILSIIFFVSLFFRKKQVPLVMLFPVLFGGLFSIAAIALVKGTISSIAVASGSIVLGIALNYSLHFFSHYKHCKNIRQTLADLYLPLTLGGFTTIASFLALMLLESPILNDFGLFAGLSLTGAAFFTLVFLPHFAPDFAEVKENNIEKFITRLKPISTKATAVLSLMIVVLTVFFFTHAGKVSFETDMNSMNFQSDFLKHSEKEILWLQNDTAKSIFIAATAAGKEELLQRNEQLMSVLNDFQAAGTVKQFSSLSAVIASKKEQAERLERWRAYWTEEKQNVLMKTLREEGKRIGFSTIAFERFGTLLSNNFELMGEEDEAILFGTLGSELLVKAKNFDAIVNAVTVEKANRTALYEALSRLPGVAILDKQIITNSFIDSIYKDFNAILAYTVFIVSIALIIGYGRIELALITFLPMLISWIWILGIMGLFGLHFNIINIIISTFIFGLGDDFSIFITDGLTRKFKENKPVFASHKVSIFLCAVATLLGLGVLIFAKHPALKSIAAISIIGILCVVIIGQTIQPLLFNFFIQSRKEKGLAPWTIPSLALAVFAFSYFVFGALLLTVIGFLLLYVFPFPKRKFRKYAYHFLLSKFVGSLVYIMMNVRKVHINKHTMDFSKPAVIISNHMSFLDILVVAMQHPKMILLTNKWVYHSPVFGRVVQMAEYYPVMEGADPATEKLQSIVEQGYSIAVFPEGTRTPDGVMKRFHKGAFFLAEKLNMDIVPLVLHGTGDTMRKGDFMLFNGTMTMRFLPRITPNDQRFGEGYAARAKNISKHFKQEYDLLKAELETPSYFRQRLMANYHYKGWNVEWAAMRAARQTDFYLMLNALLHNALSITEFGCGWGFNAYMLHFLNRNRTLTGIDVDEEKVDTANNCYSKSNKLQFVCADAACYDVEHQDAVMVNSFFFSMETDAQEKLIRSFESKTESILFISKVETADRCFDVAIKMLPQFVVDQHYCGAKSKYAIISCKRNPK